jgi:holo-[acyl-carrier protein] synthase
MILGIGHDLVDGRRIEALLARHGERFLDRVFTPEEQVYAAGRPERLARRFAAKEACAKALGTGIGESALFREIAVTRSSCGQPALALSGRAAATLSRMIPSGLAPVLHLSMTDDWPFASAFVIIEAVKRECGQGGYGS